MSNHSLAVSKLTKVFDTDDGPVVAVDEVSFELSGSEFFTLLGPSGCGKTTTLRMIAGLETCSAGTIRFDGQDFTKFSARRRSIGMVFQSYALFPHLTVFENAAYGLRVRGVASAAVKSKVTAILRLLSLQDLQGRYPSDLSGGQQQRVSIARALAYDPGMLLLDEPLANLDAKLRVEMRDEIRRIQKELGIMSIYVTHDQEEAMSISDRLGIFNLGKLVQCGKPQEIYTHPTSLFVADFIGSANFFPGRIVGRDAVSASVALNGGQTVAVRRLQVLNKQEAAQVPLGFDGLLMVRPENIRIGPQDGQNINCNVSRIQFLGSFLRVIATCASATRDVVVDSAMAVPALSERATASLQFSGEDAHFFYLEAPR